ncbi:hypothetical protein A2U01_0066809, partial [Trifolium medium]|nr:hypothetical protein [Trifolium medium]
GHQNQSNSEPTTTHTSRILNHARSRAHTIQKKRTTAAPSKNTHEPEHDGKTAQTRTGLDEHGTAAAAQPPSILRCKREQTGSAVVWGGELNAPPTFE